MTESQTLSTQDLLGLRYERLSEKYVMDSWSRLQEYHQDRKNRLDVLDALYRGDWSVVFPDEQSVLELPKTTNLIQVQLEDMARLTAETDASIRCEPKNESDTAKQAAEVEEHIYFGYEAYNDIETLVPRWTMDLAGAGMAMGLVYVKPGERYPTITRLDPRSAMPTILNGVCTDLITSQRMRARQVEALRGITLNMDPNAEVDVVAYYDEAGFMEIAAPVTAQRARGGPILLQKMPNPLGILPVGFVQLDTFDGAIRGMFDQIAGNLQAKNRIINLILEATDQAVSSPLWLPVDVDASEFGPGGVVKALTPEAQPPSRIVPAQVAPQLWQLLAELDSESRSATGYPSQRQGENVGSIISGAGVNSTLGQLTTTVRYLQSLIGELREQLLEAAAAYDRRVLNVEKPLLRPVGRKSTYKPEKDLSDEYRCEVVYGLGGLNTMNQHVLVEQMVGNRLMSRRRAMTLLPEVLDPVGEWSAMEQEQVLDALLQKSATDPNFPLFDLAARMGEGMSLFEAAAAVKEEQAQMQAQQQAQMQQPGMPGAMPGAPPEQAATDQLALQKGAIPQGPPQAGAAPVSLLTPPPRSQIYTG